MAPGAGGGLVLLNHDSTALGGYGVISTGDCLLSGAGSTHRRDSSAYKTTADLLQLCGSAGYHRERGGCSMPPEAAADAAASPHGGRFPNSGGIYATGTYRYGRAGDGSVTAGPDSDDTGFLSTCTCGYDDCRHGDLENSTSTTAISSEADLLQSHLQPPPSSSSADDKSTRQVCFTEELVRHKLLFNRYAGDGCNDPTPSNRGPTATIYDRAPVGARALPSAAGGASDDLAMRTFKGSPSTRNQSSGLSPGAANTLPRGGASSGIAATGSSGYDSATYRALGITSHICS
jgi:hypothetical protein